MAYCFIPVSGRAGLALVFGLVLATPLAAQTPSPVAPSQPPMNSRPAPSAVDDDELQRFAAATGEVLQIRRKWAPQVESATRQGPDAQLQAQDDAHSEMVGAVEDRGLSVTRYNQIAEAVQSDPALRQKVEEHMSGMH